MTYDELYQSIIDFTESNDTTFVDNIPTFVQNAEERIYNSVLIPVLRRNVTGSMTINNKYLTCPSDYLAPYEMAVSVSNGLVPPTYSYEYLLQKDVSYVRQAYPTPTSTGVPKYYAQFDENTFIIGPTPDANYTVELHYYYYPESIVTLGTSWIGENFPNCFLYGSLVEANIFLKGEADVQQNYEKLFADNMGLLKNYADGRTRNDNFRRPLPRGKFQ
jgi:hypothetical protein